MSGYIDPAELRDQGYLLEANRRFFHPLGLALEITVATEPAALLKLTSGGLAALEALVAAARAAELLPTAYLEALEERIAEADRLDAGDAWVSGIRDERDDPEGFRFDAADPEYAEEVAAKADAVAGEWERRRPDREAALGYMVQPV